MLDVTVRGFGDGVGRARLDGRPVARAEVPASLDGAHTVEIEMNGRWPAASHRAADNRFAPATPVATLRGDTLTWAPVPGAARYAIHRNGRRSSAKTATHILVRPDGALAEYQVLAVDSAGLESFLSEPVRVVSEGGEVVAQPPAAVLEREHEGFTGSGYVRLTREGNTTFEIPVRVPRAGVYAVDARYANGNGPINTGDKAALRTLLVDGKPAGVLVMPHRGADLWTDWGYTNPVRVRLAAGAHRLTVAYTPLDENMNRLENTALLDHVRLTRLADSPAPLSDGR